MSNGVAACCLANLNRTHDKRKKANQKNEQDEKKDKIVKSDHKSGSIAWFPTRGRRSLAYECAPAWTSRLTSCSWSRCAIWASSAILKLRSGHGSHRWKICGVSLAIAGTYRTSSAVLRLCGWHDWRSQGRYRVALSVPRSSLCIFSSQLIKRRPK